MKNIAVLEQSVTTEITLLEKFFKKNRISKLSLMPLLTEESRRIGLHQKCNREGLPREAIIPTDVFRKFSKEAGCYTFTTLKKGRVKAHVRNLVNEFKVGFSGKTLAVIYWFVIALITIAQFIWITPMRGWISLGATVTASAALKGLDLGKGKKITNFSKLLAQILSETVRGREELMLSILWLLFFALFTPGAMLYTIALIFYSRYERKKNLKSLYWPELTDEDCTENDFVPVEFLAPPPEIDKRIRKWRSKGYKPYWVIHHDAFTTAIDKEVRVKLNEYTIEADPMCCVDIGRHTVIVSQYGGSLPEELMLKTAKEHFTLVKKELLFLNWN